MTPEEITEMLNKIDVQVSISHKDIARVFAAAVVANVISSVVVMGAVGYLARKDRKNKAQTENKENAE